MSKASATIGRGRVASAPDSENRTGATSKAHQGTCPACNSAEFESVLSTGGGSTPRTLIACGRCSLLRILGSTSQCRALTFADAVHFLIPDKTPFDSLCGVLLQRALRSKLRFLSQAALRKESKSVVLDCGGGDGTVAQSLEAFDARSLAVVQDPAGLPCSDHRQGVRTVTADPADPPVRASIFDTVCRLRGLAHDEDPVHWLQCARRLLKPGGNLVVQTFDSGSWAFLVTGSHWAGLEGDCASYAFRAADLDVLLDSCGYQVTRRSHFFPLLNASIWASSLFPRLDPYRRRTGAAPSTWRTLALDGVYTALLALLSPVALMDSVCRTGSVVMLEAKLK